MFTDIDECLSSPCENSANCSQYLDYFNCTCELGFNGTLCEHSKSPSSKFTLTDTTRTLKPSL